MKKNLSVFLIIWLFIIWIWFWIYAYLSGIDLKDFFSWNKFSLETKIFFLSLLYIFRNYLLIPSTILILLTWFILRDFWLTLAISTIWVGIWILQTYFVWKTFSKNLENSKKFQVIENYRKKIKENWFQVIFFASLIPIIPVDLVYYAAALSKYDIKKFFLAGILWELPLIILYSYLWKNAEKYIFFIWWFFIILGIFYFSYKFFRREKNTQNC